MHTHETGLQLNTVVTPEFRLHARTLMAKVVMWVIVCVCVCMNECACMHMNRDCS